MFWMNWKEKLRMSLNGRVIKYPVAQMFTAIGANLKFMPTNKNRNPTCGFLLILALRKSGNNLKITLVWKSYNSK